DPPAGARGDRRRGADGRSSTARPRPADPADRSGGARWLAAARTQLGRDDRDWRAAVRLGAAEAVLQHAFLLEDDVSAVGHAVRGQRSAESDADGGRTDDSRGAETGRRRLVAAVVWGRSRRALDRLLRVEIKRGER